MEVRVRVVPKDEGRPAAGTPVQIELRDVSLADAPSTVVARAETVVGDDPDGPIAVATVEVDDATWQRAAGLSFWARADVNGTPRTSPGDWITMESVPLPAHVGEVDIPVRRVG
jgi:hypothetical protein